MAVNHQKWYTYYNNCNDKLNSLLSNTTLYDKSVLIATKDVNHANFMFTKFVSIEQFYQYYCNTTFDNHMFYAILTTTQRFLYLDIDYKLESKLDKYEIRTLSKNIYDCLIKFVHTYGNQFEFKNNNNDWLIWNGSRNNKFSLHILNPQQLLNIKLQKTFALKFDSWLHINNKVPKQLRIDSCIYHSNYQLWRLPYCHNGDKNSVLVLQNSKLPLIKQFELSCMVNIPEKYKLNNKIINNIQKISTLSKNEIKVESLRYNHCIIQNLLQTNNIKPYKNHELIVKQHLCPISQQKHQNNTARIKLYYVTNTIMYCVFTCMKDTCREIMKQKYINLSHKWNYPWVIEHLIKINKLLIIEKVDTLLKKTFDTKILTFNKTAYSNAIIKTSKLRFNINNMLFSCFFTDDVIHSKCLKNALYMYSKNKTHYKYYSDEVTIYCNNCKIFINSS